MDNKKSHLVYNKGTFFLSWIKEPLEQLEKARAIKLAVETLVKVLKEDPDYYMSWQANIAMQFKDEFDRKADKCGHKVIFVANAEAIHEIANKAAQNFLNLLIR